MRRIIIVLSVVAALVYGVSPAQVGIDGTAPSAGERLSEDCRRVVLTHKPGWAHTGGFAANGELYVVDALDKTILRYSADGQSRGSVGDPLKSLLGNLLPATGKFRGSEFILEVSDGLMRLDKNLRPIVTKRVIPRTEVLPEPQADWKIGGFWQWEPVGSKDIVAFVDMFHGDSSDLANWKTGFVRFSQDAPEQLEIIKDFELTGTPNKGYYRSGYRYMASLGEAAYILSMNQGMTLYRHEHGKVPEDVTFLLPSGLTAPALPDWFRMNEYVDMMGMVQRESMPVGLHSWNNSLYLLYRKSHGQRTQWLLYKLDPSRRKAPQVVELSIQGEHVTVMPGRERWALLEKGPVLSYGAQEIPRMLLIKSEVLAAPFRPGLKICN